MIHFWMAQVSQVDITPKRTFELLPTIGNHVIDFGDASDCDQKFHRLFVFYKAVLSKTGMEKYSRINVQYEKQVIGVRNNYLSKNDSLKFVRSIETLIASSQRIDTVRKDTVLTTRKLSESRMQNSEVEKIDSGLKYVKQ